MVFIESKLFEHLRNDYLDDEQYRLLQNFLMNNTGKRGGMRVIYLFLDKKQHCHFLTMYAKNTVSDLTTKEKKLLKQIVEDIKNDH